MAFERTRTISAPGKVLVTGGYLVLDREYSGLVIGTSARFYSTVTSSSSSFSTSSGKPKISVHSPQFLDGSWDYELTLPSAPSDACKITLTSVLRNRYVECALVHSLNVASVLSPDFVSLAKTGLSITIVGDNDFYSQRMQLDRKSLPLTSVSLASLPKFCSTLTTIPKVSKTGLGSSAAMITSLTAAILSYFDVINLSSRDNRDLALVHNVAQFAHCLAQGKIGSGFDVSAAVYGSHSYRRFSPDALGELLQKSGDPLEESALTAKDIVAKLDPASATNWDCEVEQFKLPPGFKLMLADIDAGSNTPKLVSQVLKWRQDSPEEAQELWSTLHQKNKKCQEVFQALNTASQDYPEEYWNALANINNLELSTGSVSEHLNHLKNTFAQIRHLLRDMSTKANTPVEPIEQTTLLDACTAIPGVIMAGVPGAGGYDAIFVIYIDHNNVSPRSQIEQVWSGWTRMLVGPLLAGEDFVGITVEPDFSYTA